MDIINTGNEPANGPGALVTAQVGGQTYVYGAVYPSNLLVAYSLGADGVMTPIQSTTSFGPQGLHVCHVGGADYLFSALYSGVVATYSIDPANGQLTQLQLLGDDVGLQINGATAFTSLVLGGVTYLAVSGRVDNGISLFAVGADGSLTNTANVHDDAATALNAAWQMTTVTVGGGAFLVATNGTDNGLSVFEVGVGGTLANVQNIMDDRSVALGNPQGIANAVIGGVPYVFVNSGGESGVSVFSVGAGGQLTNVFNLYDDASILLNTPIGLDVFEQDGKTYLAVGSFGDNGIQIFEVAANGSLSPIASVVDDALTYLLLPSAIDTVVVGGQTYMINSGAEGGFSVFRLKGPIPDSARNDAFTTAENAGFVGNVRADNGSGADMPALAITEVNGQAASVGMRITLPSGALLTLNANGTFQYLPNGAFNGLAGAGSGAQNLTGTDTFTYTVANGDTATVTVNINGVDGQNDVLQGSSTVDNLSGGAGNDTINALAGNDRLDGGDGNDILNGGAGNDIILGGAGNDRLDGSKGGDSMTGGAGNDTYVVDDAGDTVTEAANGGVDSIEASVTYLMGADIENLLLTGQGDIGGFGNALANHMTGNSGANVLSAAGGNDVVYGMGGDDTLAGGAGADTMYGGVGNDILDGGDGGDKLYGELGSDTLIGGLQGDYIDGGAGDDVINAGGGNDTLLGGLGKDSMRGGAGNDVYYVDNLLDTVTELAGEGEDVVHATVSFVLTGNVEVLTLDGAAAINGTGDASNNRIIGNAASNIIDGGAGADIMTGGLGSDNYVVDNVGDRVIELTGEGTDTVSASLNYVLGENLENLILTGSAGLAGAGNATSNSLTGNEGANLLSGLDGNDKLVGAGGDDTLLGGLGNDNLSGGAGGDLINGGAGNDILAGGTGADLFLITSASVRLSASSALAVETDQILDFNAGTGDRIDLSQIDANAGQAGDQAFSLVTSFGMHAGEATLVYDATAHQTSLRLDIDGDGKADYQLRIDGDATHAAILSSASAPSEGGWLF
jgi:VCBS repeat-containing protein